MEENRIIQTLKEFKKSNPDSGFINHSRRTILVTSQKSTGTSSFFQNFKLFSVVALAGMLLFFILGGVSYFSSPTFGPAILIRIDEDKVKAQAEKLDLQIQLGEVTYRVESEKEIGAKIDEILKNLSL